MGNSRAIPSERTLILGIGAVMVALVLYFHFGAKAQEAEPSASPSPGEGQSQEEQSSSESPSAQEQSPSDIAPSDTESSAEPQPAEESIPEATAQELPPPPPFTFPIPELGDCVDTDGCQAYCDDLSNSQACAEFGVKHGLISEEDADKASDLPPTGPGGCEGEDECKSYCNDPAHGQECLDFAIQNGLMSEEDIKKAKLVLEGNTPGGCKSNYECDAFCSDHANDDVCFEFARENGLISGDEIHAIEENRKALGDFKEGPGGCKTEEECRNYCQDAVHTGECLDFGIKQGIIDEDEAQRIRKLALAGGPGGCKGQDECRTYCDDSSHQAECIDFAVANGFMSEEEAGFARKLAGKTGPGGCRGRECRDYCEDLTNAKSCLDFAEAEGLLSQEELARAKKFMSIADEGGPGGCRGGAECKSYCESSEHQDACFSFAKDKGLIRPEDERNFEIGKKLQQKVKESGGPGGCGNDEECRTYCGDPGHVEECVAFGAAHAGISEDEVRRMLKDFAEGRMGPKGEFGPPQDIQRFEKDMQLRFEQFRDLEARFRGAGGPGIGSFGPPASGIIEGGFPGGFPGGGPGGCTSPAECINYCREHLEECSGSYPLGPEPSPAGSGATTDFFETSGTSPSAQTKTSGSAATISIDQETTGFFRLTIRDRDGLQEFSLVLSSGSNYGAGLNGCPREYVNNTVRFSASDFPITAAYAVDCQGTRHDVLIPPPYGQSQQPQAPALEKPSPLEGFQGLPQIQALPASGGGEDCTKELYGSDVFDRIARGEFIPPPDMQAKIIECVSRKSGAPSSRALPNNLFAAIGTIVEPWREFILEFFR